MRVLVDRLPCNTIIYRTITKRRHVGADGRPIAFAFHRRPPHPETGEVRDAAGLSVDYGVSVPDGCARGFPKKEMIVSLHVGKVRDIHGDLDVVPNSPTHANITGIPREEENLEKLEQIAAALASMSRKVWPKSS